MNENNDSSYFIFKHGEEFYVNSHGDKISKDEYIKYLQSLSPEAKALLTATELGLIKSAIKSQN